MEVQTLNDKSSRSYSYCPAMQWSFVNNCFPNYPVCMHTCVIAHWRGRQRASNFTFGTADCRTVLVPVSRDSGLTSLFQLKCSPVAAPHASQVTGGVPVLPNTGEPEPDGFAGA